MKLTRRASPKIVLLFILFFMLVLPSRALAQGLDSAPLSALFEDKFVFGGSYTLEAGDRLDGNLVVFGGNVVLEATSLVDGDVNVLGGNLQADGEIDGDITCIGGNVTLGEEALVTGDIRIMGGGNLNQAPGAEIKGKIERNWSGPFNYNFPSGGLMPRMQLSVTPLADMLWFLFQIFAWSALAVLVVMFLPLQTERTGDVAIKQPVITCGVGLLTMIIASFLLVFLAITLIFLPVSLLLALLLVVVWLFGTVSLGYEIGKRIEQQFRREWPPAVTAGIGTFLFVLVIFGLSKVIPCIGWAFPVAAGAIAIGAVLLTRFGTYPYPPLATAFPSGSPISPSAPTGPVSPIPPAESTVEPTVGGARFYNVPEEGETPQERQEADDADWRPHPPE